MRRPYRIHRRDWLAGLGLAGGSLFLPSLLGRHGSSVRAADAAPPKRLILFSTMHGTLLEKWRMGTGPVDKDWELPLANMPENEFSQVLKPLYPVRSDMLVLDGLSMHSALADPQDDVGHHVGHANQWTGTFIQWGGGGPHKSTGPSLDQVVARAIARPDRVPSLELGMPHLWGSALWAENGTRIEMEDDIPRIFNRLFPASFNPGAAPTDADRIAAGKSSMLDLVARRHDAVSKRLGAADKAKLGIHRDLIRMLEKRVAALPNIAGCQRPPAADPISSRQAPDYYRKTWAAFMPLVAAALACDLTRVVSLQPSDLLDQATLEGWGFPAGRDVHSYEHEMPMTIFRKEGSPESRIKVARYHQYLSEMLRDFVTLLKNIPEGNGSLLDNCLVVWTSELGNGVHYFYEWPVVIFGSAGGQFRTGRYVKYAEDIPDNNPLAETSYPRGFGPPHNKLLVSVANAVGAPITSIGKTSVHSKKWTANPVDCTGPLSRLT